MITLELEKKRESKKCWAHCAICAEPSVKIVKLSSNFTVVSMRCGDAFSGKDLELMCNMFTAFGGYFGECL